MPLFPFALALLAITHPTTIIDRALRAVEADRGPARRSELRRQVHAREDRAASLELATIERLLYEPDSARVHYESVVAGGRPDLLSVAASIGLAQLDIAAGRWEQLDARLQGSSNDALALGDTSLAVAALLELAPVASRSGTGTDSDTLLARAARLLPDTATRLWARLRCLRAGPPVTAGELGEDEETLAGLALARRSGDRRVEAVCLSNYAKALLRRGLIDSAIATNARAITLQQATRDGAGLAATLQWHGYALVAARDYGQARRTLLAALDASRSSGNWLPSTTTLTSLASLSVRFGELGGARRYAAMGDSIASSVGNERARAGLATVRGDVARASGDTAAARRFYDDALARSGQGGYGAVAPYRGLAALARLAGDYDAAEQQLARAREIAKKQGMTEWSRRLDYDAGGIALARGDLSRARAAYESFLAALPPGERSQALGARLHLAEIEARHGRVARAESLATAAFDDMDAWRQQADDRTLRLHAFAQRELDLDQGSGVATIVSALAAEGRPEAALGLAERSRGRVLVDAQSRFRAWAGVPGRPAAGSGPHALPDSTAIVEFVLGRADEPGTGLIVTRDGVIAVAGPGSRGLAEAAARFRALVEGGVAPQEIDDGLTQALVARVFEAVPAQVTTIAVVPDGPLHRIPFDALRAGTGLLMDRAALVLATSASAVLASGGSITPARVLVLANPATARRAPGATESDLLWRAFADAGGLPPLPASEREARTAAAFGSGSLVRTRQSATEAFAKQGNLEGYSLVHIAAHAVVSDDDVGGAALALAPGGGHDGLLTAGDLAALRLQAELVVLSGCRTAGGALIAGEGVQGLTAPLLTAGSRRVLATGWAIRDGDAARFMEYFYRELAVDGAVAPALRRAKLAARAGRVPAAVWSAFWLSGDPSGGFSGGGTLVRAAR